MCECVEGGLFGYVIQKSGLQIYCILTLKKVDLMYMYFMYFSESSRYLYKVPTCILAAAENADLTHAHLLTPPPPSFFFSDRLSSQVAKQRSAVENHDI